MQNKNILFKLSAILSETCCYIIFYDMFVMGILRQNAAGNPALLFIAGGFFCLLNIFLSFRRLMLIVITLINLFAVVLFLWLMTIYTHVPLLSYPENIEVAINLFLFQLSVVWVIGRSIYIAWNHKMINAYGHFDMFIALTFFIFLAADVLKAEISGFAIWVAVSLFLNLFSLYILNNVEKNRNPFAVWVLAGVVAIIIFFSRESGSLFSYISGSAGFMYDIFGSGFMFIVGILEAAIKYFMGIRKFIRLRGEPANGGGGGEEAIYQADPIGAPGWLDIAAEVLTGIIALLLAAVIIYVLYCLVRWFVSKMFVRKGGREREGYEPFAYWKRLFIWLRKKCAGIALPGFIETLMILIISRRIGIKQVYRSFQRWGKSKRQSRKPHETPNEYCDRLSSRYPGLSKEMRQITSLYVEYRYSGSNDEISSRDELRGLLRKIYFYKE